MQLVELLKKMMLGPYYLIVFIFVVVLSIQFITHTLIGIAILPMIYLTPISDFFGGTIPTLIIFWTSLFFIIGMRWVFKSQKKGS